MATRLAAELQTRAHAGPDRAATARARLRGGEIDSEVAATRVWKRRPGRCRTPGAISGGRRETWKSRPNLVVRHPHAPAKPSPSDPARIESRTAGLPA